MNKKLIALMFALGLSSLTSFACDLNGSNSQSAYFSYEVSKINNSSSFTYETVSSFRENYSAEKLYFNNYSNPEDALRYMNNTLAYLGAGKGLKEAYTGSTRDFAVEFMNSYDQITYCEFSDLLNEHFLVK